MIQVETVSAGFSHHFWDVGSREEAEQFARWLSIREADNPTYPNPYYVVADGYLVIGFYQGQRVLPRPRPPLPQVAERKTAPGLAATIPCRSGY